MNISEATVLAYKTDGYIKNPFRSYVLSVSPGKVFRDTKYVEWEMDARDCMSDNWIVEDNDMPVEPQSHL